MAARSVRRSRYGSSERDVRAATIHFVALAQHKIDVRHARLFQTARASTGDPHHGGQKLHIEWGKRYARITARDLRIAAGGLAWAFVDLTNGDILKPASFKTPAKGARGSVFNADPLTGIGPYGPAPARGLVYGWSDRSRRTR